MNVHCWCMLHVKPLLGYVALLWSCDVRKEDDEDDDVFAEGYGIVCYELTHPSTRVISLSHSEAVIPFR